MRSAVPNGLVICALACDPLIADKRQAAGRADEGMARLADEEKKTEETERSICCPSA
jgi:hypothetical protein